MLEKLPFYDMQVPLAIVHRGGDAAGVEKENSLAAFDSAYKAGLRYGETDTVATRDGVALAIHGSSGLRQQRKTGLPLRTLLQQMSFSQVQSQIRVGGEKVPTLHEILTSFPSMRFFIDPKTDQSVGPLADLINKQRLHDRVAIGAFNFGRTKAVAELAGKKKRLCTTVGVRGSFALLGSRLPFARSYIQALGATQFALPFNLVNCSTVARAHELGMRVLLWTPNSEADIRRAFDTGADGVMSDRTFLVRDIAREFRGD